jgi:hypothetical protein
MSKIHKKSLSWKYKQCEWINIAFLENTCNNKVIRKVRKTQHQNPEFGHTEGGEIQKKKLQKSTLAFNGGWNSKNHQFWW